MAKASEAADDARRHGVGGEAARLATHTAAVTASFASCAAVAARETAQGIAAGHMSHMSQVMGRCFWG